MLTVHPLSYTYIHTHIHIPTSLFVKYFTFRHFKFFIGSQHLSNEYSFRNLLVFSSNYFSKKYLLKTTFNYQKPYLNRIQTRTMLNDNRDDVGRAKYRLYCGTRFCTILLLNSLLAKNLVNRHKYGWIRLKALPSYTDDSKFFD